METNKYTFRFVASVPHSEEIEIRLNDKLIFVVRVERLERECSNQRESCILMINMIDNHDKWSEDQLKSSMFDLIAPDYMCIFGVCLKIIDKQQYLAFYERGGMRPCFKFLIPFEECDLISLRAVLEQIKEFRDTKKVNTAFELSEGSNEVPTNQYQSAWD